MVTLLDLINGTKRLRHRGNEIISSNNVTLQAIKLHLENNTLLTQGIVIGSEKYEVTIEFSRIQVNPLVGPNVINIPINNSISVNITQPIIERTPVRVACTCSDYIFSFAYYNEQKEGLFGNLETYKRKTKTRPNRNSIKTVGICKHLDAFIPLLQKEKYIQT